MKCLGVAKTPRCGVTPMVAYLDSGTFIATLSFCSEALYFSRKFGSCKVSIMIKTTKTKPAGSMLQCVHHIQRVHLCISSSFRQSSQNRYHRCYLVRLPLGPADFRGIQVINFSAYFSGQYAWTLDVL